MAQAATGWTGPGRVESGDDLSRSFTKRAYGVLADAEKASDQPTTVDLVAALVDSGGLALVVLEAADHAGVAVLGEVREGSVGLRIGHPR